ncbi:hypothetical protein [Paludibacterium denitrificans]|nr:hypothetical protein [Paludibacterium denitrificans]
MLMSTTHLRTHSTRQVNAALLDATHKAARAIEALSENGFTVTDVELKSVSRPTIRIQTSGQCHTLIAKGEAVYFSFGKRERVGQYREGQFQLGGCRIVWTEIGN